jgi:hypothetical protein
VDSLNESVATIKILVFIVVFISNLKYCLFCCYNILRLFLDFSGARRKDEGLRVKLMLKESEVGKRRLKQPCGRREFRMRRKL